MQQPLALVAHQRDVARAGFDAPLELGGELFQARHFGDRRGAALDRRGMSGAGFGGLRAQAFGRVTRIAEAALRFGERDLGRGLLLVQSRDRLARFGLPRIEAGDLFLGAADFVADQVDALLHARFVVVGALGLALHADDRFFLAMEFVGQAGDRRGGVRHRLLEARRLADQAIERRPRFGDLLAQLLDLALGREDAARSRSCRRR